MSSTVSLVVFDLGGVMIRLADGWEGACRAAGVPFRPPARPREEIIRDWRALDAELGAGRMGDDAFFTAFHRVHDGRYTIPELRAAFRAIIQEEFPGIYDTVAALKAAGYRTACLSNTSALHWADLENPATYPAIALLDVRHASHLLGCMKPDAVIYRKFEAAMGARPAEMLFFDDYADNVAGARARGWHAEQIVQDTPVVEQIHAGLRRYGVNL
ncbi:MAG TPA: HAD-IA family hydrolase [Armatimonadota bacterium]|nr:HAD-IA family hydrolase [Armatimonadota bacterium]